MTWDKNRPAGTDSIQNSDDFIRENQDCLDDAFNREHTFPGVKASTAGQHTLGACGVLKTDTTTNLGNGTGVVGAISYDTTTDQIMRDTGSALAAITHFPSGTKLIFYQDTAPIGWTTVANVGDRLLAVEGGSTYITGGTTAGNYSHTHTGPNHYHSVNNHSHTGTTAGPSALGYGFESVANGAVSKTHTHTFTTAASGPGSTAYGGTGATGGSANFRPEACVCIICEKD